MSVSDLKRDFIDAMSTVVSTVTIVTTDGAAGSACALKSHERIGTHHVMIGAVRAVRHAEGSPLLYGNRAYRDLA